MDTPAAGKSPRVSVGNGIAQNLRLDSNLDTHTPLAHLPHDGNFGINQLCLDVERLDGLPVPPSDMALDSRSWIHLTELLKQSLGNVKLKEEVWMDPISSSLYALQEMITPEEVTALVESSILLDRAKSSRFKTDPKKKVGKSETKERERDEPTSYENSENSAQKRLLRRLIWHDAREMMQRDSLSVPPTPSTAPVSFLDGAASDDNISILQQLDSTADNDLESTGDSAWMDVPNLPRLTVFRLMIQVTTTTTGLIKSGLNTIGVHFQPIIDNALEGYPLFGKDPFGDLDEDDLRHLRIVGGVFQVTCLSKDSGSIGRVLELLAFAALSLKLENHLLRDMNCPRPVLDDQSEFEPSRETTPVLSETSSIASVDDSTSKHKSKWSKGSIWGFLTGNSSSDAEGSPEVPRPGKLRFKEGLKESFKDGFKMRKSRARRLDNCSIGSGNFEPADISLSPWDFIGGIGLGIGMSSKQAESPMKSSSILTWSNKEDQDEVETDRLQRVIKKMERCVLSVSPNVIFPPPHLLVRLRQRELENLEAPAVSMEKPLPEVPLNKPLPSPGDSHLSAPQTGRRGLSINDGETLAMGFANGKTGGEDSASVNSRMPGISIDARVGLASLMTNNNSLGGTIRHQSMQFLVESACESAEGELQLCDVPRWLEYEYYDEHSNPENVDSNCILVDLSLGKLIEKLVHSTNNICGNPKCKKLRRDHLLFWAHNSERVVLSIIPISEMADQDNAISLVTGSDLPRITSWISCQKCQAQTPVSLLSYASYLYSFSKYLELLLYDPDLVPSPKLCEHADDRSNLVHSFCMDHFSINISISPIQLYELRLPMAVDPEYDIIPEIFDDQPSHDLRSQIIRFFEAVTKRLDILEQCIDTSEPKTLTKSDIKKFSTETSRERAKSDATILQGHDREKTITTIPKGAQKVAALRERFQEDEIDLFDAMANLPPDRLNNVRWQLLDRIKAITARLSAWETKHNDEFTIDPGALELPIPFYAEKDLHVFPVDSSVIVRESELSSAIALALSCPAFRQEVANPTAHGTRSVPGLSLKESQSSLSSRYSTRSAIPVQFMQADATSTKATPANTPPRTPISATIGSDPDDFLSDFPGMDEFQWETKLQKPPKVGSLILGLGRAGMSRKPSETLKFTREPSIVTPSIDEEKRISDQILEDLVQTDEAPVPPPSPRPLAEKSKHIPRLIKTSMVKSLKTAPTESINHDLLAQLETPDNVREATKAKDEDKSMTDLLKESDVEVDLEPPPAPTGSRIAQAFWTLSSTIRSVSGQSTKSMGSSGSHVKFKCREGDAWFRVTAYYAQQFQELRRKCGISEESFIRSLSRCVDLQPDGGKSKAAFWITQDKRYLFKELTSKWGVSEKDGFLGFASDLLKYMGNTEHPSLIAKIFGFYTIKIKNKKAGSLIKLDLIVMEHLFGAEKITRQFDLKGVASRKAKEKAGGATTGWDGDWLEGSLKTRMLIYSHSKTLLKEALQSDCAFLSKSGIIDYSMLVGVDEKRKELVIGLIDTLGVFNTFKLLENVGKTAVKKATNGDDVTIIPPEEYATRFKNGMEKCFLSVPEKFSRVQSEDSDPRLASVL